jgi:signal transduction histidine kinase
VDDARLEALTTSDEPLLMTTGDQRIVWSNEAAARLFEVPAAELASLSMKEVLALPPRVVEEACRAVTRHGYLARQVDIVTGSGRTVPSHCRAFALGEAHLVAFGARAPAAAIEVATAGRLPVPAEIAAAVGHEIRTPLATALVYMEIAQRGIPRRGPVRAALATALEEITRVERLVTRVTEMQGLGFPVMRPRRVDLGRVVADSVRRAAPADDAAPPVRLEIGRGDLSGWWDDVAVDQIVQNLLSNALRFGEGRAVRVTVERVGRGAAARVVVRDRGVGLDESHQARILERPAGAPLASSGRSPGLGLGLWFVRALAEAHRGTVAIHSRPGDGATFTVTLRPLAP